MTPVLTYFPVDNGDMALLALESGRNVLIDINIRKPENGIRDVAKDLRDRLPEDDQGRPYVDAMLLTHPDQDHCRGLAQHFHLGPIADYKEPKKGEPRKIIIREMWSSPMVFRRADKKAPLCEDAKKWRDEARRRVNLFKQKRSFIDGDRIQILGEDENGKTDGIPEIVVKTGGYLRNVDASIEGFLIAPQPKGSDDEEETRVKNNSSVIVRFSLKAGRATDACKFLVGGDAEVAIWERVWDDYKNDTAKIDYDLLLTPHHCSWHSLSYDSWSEMGEDAKVSAKARNALSQARPGARLIASSKVITDDDSDPPCIRAEREYKDIADKAKGKFLNTAIEPTAAKPAPLEFEVTPGGIRKKEAIKAVATTGSVVGSQPLVHG